MIVYSFFDQSGVFVQPWADAGWECVCVDVENDPRTEGNITFVRADVRKFKPAKPAAFAAFFPPCTDLAVSGAAHFKDKGKKAREEAMKLVYWSYKTGERLGCPYFIENPRSVIASEWRPADYTFQPWHYTNYNKDDNYTKLTCLWVGGGLNMPPKSIDMSLPPPDKERMRAKWSKSTRARMRSRTPAGFSRAVFFADCERRRLLQAKSEEDTKKCSQCGVEKPLSDFHRRSAALDGHAAACKSCLSRRKKDVKRPLQHNRRAMGL